MVSKATVTMLKNLFRYRLKNPEKIKAQAKKDYLTQKSKPDFKLKRTLYNNKRKEEQYNKEVVNAIAS
jgi:hypothetical protein